MSIFFRGEISEYLSFYQADRTLLLTREISQVMSQIIGTRKYFICPIFYGFGNGTDDYLCLSLCFFDSDYMYLIF